MKQDCMSVAAVLLGKRRGLVLPRKSYQAGATRGGGNLLLCSFSASTCCNSKIGQKADVYAK